MLFGAFTLDTANTRASLVIQGTLCLRPRKSSGSGRLRRSRLETNVKSTGLGLIFVGGPPTMTHAANMDYLIDESIEWDLFHGDEHSTNQHCGYGHQPATTEVQARHISSAYDGATNLPRIWVPIQHISTSSITGRTVDPISCLSLATQS